MILLFIDYVKCAIPARDVTEVDIKSLGLEQLSLTSQDAKVDLKPLIVAVIPIYYLSETINLFNFLFLYVFNKLIIFSAS